MIINYHSKGEDNVIDLQDHSYALSCKSECADRDKGRLDNFLFKHIFD